MWWPCSASIFLSSFAVVSSSCVIFSSINLLTSAVIFDYLPEPSFLPIVPLSVYFLRNFWIPCLVAGRFSFVRILAIAGALKPSCQRETILCRLYSLNLAMLYSARNRLIPLHFQSDIHTCTQCVQLLSNAQSCNFARSTFQLRNNFARCSLDVYDNFARSSQHSFARSSQQLRSKFAKYELRMVTYFPCLP